MNVHGSTENQPLTVVVTGAAGQIAYSLLPFIFKGDVFGKSQKVDLRLLEITPMLKRLQGVKMELEDSNSYLLTNITTTDDPQTAYTGADYAIMLGGFPRKPGMERKDLLARNRPIFESAGKALSQFAKPNVKVLVVANPANSNALVLKRSSGLPAQNISALTRLDQNRATSLLARDNGVSSDSVQGVIIWGNHSKTQVPNVKLAKINGVAASKKPNFGLKDPLDTFIAKIQNRGAEVIEMRQQSSAMSAAAAICDHIHDLHFGSNGKPLSMAVYTNGNPFGIAKDIFFSFPVECLGNGEWRFWTQELNNSGRESSEFKAQLTFSEKELLQERKAFE